MLRVREKESTREKKGERERKIEGGRENEGERERERGWGVREIKITWQRTVSYVS